MSEHKSRFRDDEYWNDLDPGDDAGESDLEDPEFGRSAYDVKALQEKWPGFSNQILKQIPVLNPGTRLKTGAAYLDLLHPERGAFKSTGGSEVEPDRYLVAKEDVDYKLWNALTGIEDNYRQERVAANGPPELLIN